MALTFEWDPQKAVENERKHGVSFDEVATTFGDPFGTVTDDPGQSLGEPRLLLLGYSQPTASLRSCSPSVVTAFVSSALGQRLVANAKIMKKASAQRPRRVDPDDILPEYDFSKGRRNPYAARIAGGHIVVLEPEVAKMFPNAAAVNKALRALAGITRGHGRRRPTFY